MGWAWGSYRVGDLEHGAHRRCVVANHDVFHDLEVLERAVLELGGEVPCPQSALRHAGSGGRRLRGTDVLGSSGRHSQP